VIFSKSDHIQQIILGTKTQTRRPSDRYQVGKTYAIQPGRGKPAIPEGRIFITDKWMETRVLGVGGTSYLFPCHPSTRLALRTPKRREATPRRSMRSYTRRCIPIGGSLCV